MKKPRSALEKSTFISSTRSKWFAVMIAVLLIVLFADVKSEIDPGPYLNFLVIGGSVFLLGGSVDSVMKIQAAVKKQESDIIIKENEELTKE
jgi:hypothetical protein